MARSISSFHRRVVRTVNPSGLGGSVTRAAKGGMEKGIPILAPISRRLRSEAVPRGLSGDCERGVRLTAIGCRRHKRDRRHAEGGISGSVEELGHGGGVA
jgi:hypothetical protein